MAEISRVAILQAVPRFGDPAEFKYCLPSIVSVVPDVVDVLMSRINSFRIADGSEDDIELALQEALVNAVIHGNKKDPFKRVYVTVRCSREGDVQITVRDEGVGFHLGSVPDPTARENLLLMHGRGIFLMRTLMDEVSFEHGGAVVRMRKRRAPARSCLARL